MGLGRIYDDLGFERARADGRVAVAVGDPTSDSAHRFLADAYSVLPRSKKIARVSELLQSQLYQPLNLHPVQPEVALGRSFILRGTGPADRPPTSTAVSSATESRSSPAASWGPTTRTRTRSRCAHLYGPVSVSFGGFHYETDGFRPNNDLTRDAYDLFAQVALSPSTSILAELRYEDVRARPLSSTPRTSIPTSGGADAETSSTATRSHPGPELIGTAAYFDAEFPTRDVSFRDSTFTRT